MRAKTADSFGHGKAQTLRLHKPQPVVFDGRSSRCQTWKTIYLREDLPGNQDNLDGR